MTTTAERISDATKVAETIPGAEYRYTLTAVNWKFYVGLMKLFGNHHPWVTYSKGCVEFMKASYHHEWIRTSLDCMVCTAAEETGVPYSACGRMTIHRSDLQVGFDPDGCFYIQNLKAVGYRRQPNFLVDPPPDLSVEVDISPGYINRIKLYESVGVSELWYYNQGRFNFLLLNKRGKYAARKKSRCFSWLHDEMILPFLEVEYQNKTKLTRDFRAFVHEHAPPRR